MDDAAPSYKSRMMHKQKQKEPVSSFYLLFLLGDY